MGTTVNNLPFNSYTTQNGASDAGPGGSTASGGSSSTGGTGSGSLFSHLSNGITVQGSYGDCTYIAGVNSLLSTNPSELEEHVHDTGATPGGGEGFDVQLFESQSWTTYHVDTAQIDKDSNRSKGVDGKDTLGTIYEAAVLQAHGKDTVNKGNHPEQSLTELVGPGVTFNTAHDASRLASDVLNHGAGVVDLGVGQQAGWYNSQTGSYDGKTQKSGDVYITGDHQYSVVGIDNSGSNPGVTVDNPWNTRDNGAAHFTLTQQALATIFGDQVSWSPTSGSGE